MTLQLLRPGESSLVEFSPSATLEYPLDSILVVPYQDDHLQRVARAIRHARTAPWLPVLIGSGRTPLPARELDGLARGLHLATIPYALRSRANATAIRDAIRSRGAPSDEAFVAWCGLRLDARLEPVLTKVLSRAPLSRREVAILRQYGGLSQLEWRALRLLGQLHGDSHAECRSLEWLAGNRRSTRKTVWEWATKLIGMSWTRLETSTAWEALVELALRRRSHLCGPPSLGDPVRA